MNTHTKKNRGQISQMLGSLLSFGLFMYFGVHLMHGDMGYFALKGLEQKLSDTQTKRDQIVAERMALENRVRRLRPGSLDLDMLDERVRAVLGYADPDERVILQK